MFWLIRLAVLGGVLSTLVNPGGLAAADNQVVYEASGVFVSPPVSGSDLFKLQGEPFNLNITANANASPKHHGNEWAVYTPLVMDSTVESGLLNLPTTIDSGSLSLELQKGENELLEFSTPIKLVGLKLTISSTVMLPAGTLSTLLIHPFTAPVTLTPANATLTYSDASGSTTLAIIGTLKTVVKSKFGR